MKNDPCNELSISEKNDRPLGNTNIPLRGESGLNRIKRGKFAILHILCIYVICI